MIKAKSIDSSNVQVDEQVEKVPSSKRKKVIKEHLFGYGFIMPTTILLTLFTFYPFFKSIFLSFFMTDPLGNIVKFVGFDNYIKLIEDDSFINSLLVTGKFILYTVPIGILLALILATMTHNKLKGMKIFQFFFSLPIAMSVGTSSLIWLILFNPTAGILNYLLVSAGLDPIRWLTDPNWALISVSIMTIWMGLGFNYIILLAGVQNIPEEIYESARIDGAGKIATFFKITIPLTSPTLFFVLIISVINTMQAFGQFNILTSGGPVETTNVFVFSLYQEAFVNFQFGLGSARAVILFIMILILTWLQFKFGEKKVHYQ